MEWFVNTPCGLEHSFTLAERPAPLGNTGESPTLPTSQEQRLRLIIAVSGDLAPHTDAAGQRLELRDAAGRTVLSYEKLKVWDATGAELPATMEAGEGRVTLAVNDATARYPLTIDPTFFERNYSGRNGGE